jgi:hypothetical protein
MIEALKKANTPTMMMVLLALPSIMASCRQHQSSDSLMYEEEWRSGHVEKSRVGCEGGGG